MQGKKEEASSLCAKENAVFPQCVGTPPAQEDWQGQGEPGPDKDHGEAAAHGRHGRLARLASFFSTIIQPTTNPSNYAAQHPSLTSLLFSCCVTQMPLRRLSQRGHWTRPSPKRQEQTWSESGYIRCGRARLFPSVHSRPPLLILSTPIATSLAGHMCLKFRVCDRTIVCHPESTEPGSLVQTLFLVRVAFTSILFQGAVRCNAHAGSEVRGSPSVLPLRISCRHENADPTWFVISHVDETGRRWCHADAILTMQGLVRGWVIRQKRKRAQLREERNKKSKYAVQIQRWWRRYLFRKFVAQLRRERIAQAYIDILRFVKLCPAASPPC